MANTKAKKDWDKSSFVKFGRNLLRDYCKDKKRGKLESMKWLKEGKRKKKWGKKMKDKTKLKERKIKN